MPPFRRPQRWTLPLLLLLALLLLLGGAATFFGVAGTPDAYQADFMKASFVLNAVLMAVCLAGVCLAPHTLMRVGFLFCALAARNVLLAPAVFLGGLEGLGTSGALGNLELALFDEAYYPFLTGVLSVLGLICLSYGWARWQRSDPLLLWMQLMFTLGVGMVLLKLPYLPDLFPQLAPYDLSLLVSEGTPFLALAGIACFLLRPACWKASPLTVVCLSVGQGLFLLGGGVLFFIHTDAFPWVLTLEAAWIPGQQPEVFFWQLGFKIMCGLSLAGETLLIPGWFLLIWRARGQKLHPSVIQSPC